MSHVNYWIIYSALGALEANEAKYGDMGIDPDDAVSVRNAIRETVLPRVTRWSAPWREKLRLSLAYYLRRPDVLSNSILANLQDLSMPEPNNVVSFFQIVWDVLFPEQECDDICLDGVIENADLMEINDIR